MSLPHLRRSGWIVLLLAAIGFIVWTTSVRIERIDHVNRIGQMDAAGAGPRPLRQLIVPEHLVASYEWIAGTETMLRENTWRIRHTAMENAPHGRPVHAASPYRWWLGTLAAGFDAASPGGLTHAVEHAALWADPLLHVLWLIATSLLAARCFGPSGGALVAIGGATLFPFAAGFLPGVPDDFALLLLLAPWLVLPLVLGHRVAMGEPQQPRAAWAWFAMAGALAGGALWLNVGIAVPLLVGVGLGALAAAACARGIPTAPSLDRLWRCWGLVGAATVLLAYLVEYAPAHLGEWELRAVHPVYGLALWGGAEVLGLIASALQRAQRPRGAQTWVRLGLGLAAVGALPIAMARSQSMGFLTIDLLAFRLTKQTDGVLAPTFWNWLGRDGLGATAATTLASVLLFGAVVWLAVRRPTPAPSRTALALTLGPVLAALVLAQFHLRWWQLFGALLLVALLAAMPALAQTRRPAGWRGGVWGLFGIVALLGLIQVGPWNAMRGRNLLSLPEVEGLVERDLAHTLAKRLGGGDAAVVHAPPSVTSALAYYGRLRGLSSLSWENKAGLSVALRVVISTSREEAHALALSRGVTHLVVASWDPFYDSYTRSASVQASELFYDSLRRWVVPLWLRPIPYRLPTISGFENQSVTVFEVVDEQDPPIAMSRVTEYFIEMGQLDAARAAGEALRRYPADFSALIARAQLEAALNDSASFGSTLETLVQRLNARADRLLPLDRRVSLAVALARGQRLDLARPQVERCLQQLDERRLRFLTTHQQFHLLYLSKLLGLSFPDPQLHQLAIDLLPAESRERL